MARGPIRVFWYQGGDMSKSPQPFIHLNKIGHGAMFKGSKGFLIADFSRRILMPYGKGADLSYYDSRKKENVTPDLGGFYED